MAHPIVLCPWLEGLRKPLNALSVWGLGKVSLLICVFLRDTQREEDVGESPDESHERGGSD